MKTLSLKMDESIFSETEDILTQIKKARNRYINDAVEYYNVLNRKKILEEQLKKDSFLVRNESMNVLGDFEAIENDSTSL